MSEPLTDLEEAAYRQAVTGWNTNPKAHHAQRIAQGAAQLLQMLDDSREEERRQRETAEAAKRGWRKTAATLGRIETERDAAVEDTERLGLEIHELTEERDRLAKQRDELLKQVAVWKQRIQDNAKYYDATGAKYEHGKAVVYDELAHQVEEIFGVYQKPEAVSPDA